MDVVALRLKGVPLYAIGEENVEKAIRAMGYVQLDDETILKLLVAGASADALARATGLTPGEIKRRAKEAYKALRGRTTGRSAEAASRQSATVERRREELVATSNDFLTRNEWVKILKSKS